jgi:trans-feruloyl-CoA hydratase/vanillin synthase
VTAFSAIRIDARDGVVTVTLNRPEKRNAMNAAMHREMHALLSDLRYDPKVRVLILTGAGEAFCAGGDFKEKLASPSEEEQIRDLSDAWRNDLLRRFSAPTIAMVNGACFGGAFSLVCVCDIAIAAEEAAFALPEIDMQRFPGGMLAANLKATLRTRELLYYAMTGERFDGRRAADIGLVTRAVPKAELAGTVQALADTLAHKDQVALRMCKELYALDTRLTYEEMYGFANAKVAQMDALRKPPAG